MQIRSLPFLVDDRVNRQGGFAGLAVANDQFALSASDRDHGINGFDTGLDRVCPHPAGRSRQGRSVRLDGIR